MCLDFLNLKNIIRVFIPSLLITLIIFAYIYYFDDIWVRYTVILVMPFVATYVVLISKELAQNHCKLAEIAGGMFLVIIGAVSLGFLSLQLYKMNEFNKFENYKYYNKVYKEWYQSIPPKIKSNLSSASKKIQLHELDAVELVWVRQYFELYSQEYYLFKKNMLPKDMWLELIHGPGCKGAAIRNLHIHPVLLEGYLYWKEKGAFHHPSDFTEILDQKLKQCALVRYISTNQEQ